MSDLDRDKFYSPPDEDELDDEYELEPPDPAVLDREKRQAQESIEAARRSIDIDTVYSDARELSGEEIFGDLFRNMQFRFQVKHLLIAISAVAVVLVLWKLDVLKHFMAIGLMGVVFAAYAFVAWREKRHHEQIEQRREEMYRQAREAREATTQKSSS